MTIMNSFISFLSPRKMKYFFKLHNVIREKGETNNFRFAGDDYRKFDFFLFFIFFFLQKLLTNLIFVQP